MRSNIRLMKGTGRFLAIAAAGALTMALGASPAFAGSGGISDGGGVATPGSDVPHGSKAKIVDGDAVPPADAPPRVVKAIAAANKIDNKPYKWGGGHGKWNDKGYDCSGAVSYMLHGARMLDSPMPSGPLTHWGDKGKGNWISVYANGGHAYAVVAGLRWDTAGDSHGTGPRWHKSTKAAGGGRYKVRHFRGF